MSEKAAKKKSPAKPAAKKKAEKVDAKVEETKTVSQKPVVKAVPPHSTVLVRHEYAMQERRGKGFSLGELSAASLTFVTAKLLRVPVDIRRRSVLEGNTDILKGWYKPEPKKAKEPTAEKKPKAAKSPKKSAKKPKKA
ncbi:MAG: ribosomal protein L13e [Thaumarchaeota archaeon]|nr:ribosomal protein L13e [Nitrososphaerota archaeon]MDA4135840.1 ribosomal protein L13e [Nitrososphaerota archaeon]